jgi:hypothetical protein
VPITAPRSAIRTSFSSSVVFASPTTQRACGCRSTR